MADYVLAIIKDENRLSERCNEVNVFESRNFVSKVVNDIKDTMKANKDLMALSAPQLGYNARIFCIRFSDGEIKTFINPMITKIKDKCIMIEKDICSDKEYMIQRPERVLVGFQTATGRAETDLSLKNPLSAIFEQMVDIIDGTLFFKYKTIGIEIDSNYYKASQKEKDELHEWYLNVYIPMKVKEMEEIANSDKDIKETRDAITFLTSVINGETELVPTFNDELDFEHSSLKTKELNDKFRTDYEKAIKKKYGVDA